MPLQIDAGLDHLPRQIATFPEYRRAMLDLMQSTQVAYTDSNNMQAIAYPLISWKARDRDDLGLMLLEMWSYVSDVLSFYDEAIANASYIRTSLLRPDIRRLVALLGYRPRPAVGSSIQLAALAEGRLPLKLPVGTAFRSGAFKGSPPQVFELDQEAMVHPLTNQWKILPPHPGIIQQSQADHLTVFPNYSLKEGDFLLLIHRTDSSQNSGFQLKGLEKYTGIDKKLYTRLRLMTSSRLVAGAKLENLKLFVPTQTAKLWTLSGHSIGSNTLVLENQIPQLKANEQILVSQDGEVRWFTITQVADVRRSPMENSEVTINGHHYNLQGMSIPVTEITLDANLNDAGRKQTPAIWDDSLRNSMTIHYSMVQAARVLDEPKNGVSESDPLEFEGFVEKPVDPIISRDFLLQDVNTRGAAVKGIVNFEENKLVLDQGTSWMPELRSPVTVFGNVITARRGEKVLNEKMGSGNASLSNQTFRLKKKPLTYYLSPTAANDNGVKNTLIVRVDGVKWTEVNSFYGRKENEQIYIVRQNDEGESLVTFGDGIRGQRLPSGIDNVLAEYHFGAEAACPPAGFVNQISKPVKGFQSIKNILPAYGGADAESAEEIKKNAPRSALVLGRIVSLQDMEAVANGFPGVQAVQAEWRWNKQKQTASAHIFYIGDTAIGTGLSQRLRSLSDPSLSISVEQAKAVPVHLNLSIIIDSRFLEAEVVSQVRQELTNSEYGVLSAQHIGIGKPLFQSRLFEVVLSVTGTLGVEGMLFNSENFGQFAYTPGVGCFFQFGESGLVINGTTN